MKELKERLKEKGWSEAEIDKTEKIMKSGDSDSRKNMNLILYWMVLLILVIGNLLVSIFLVPFLIVLQGPFLYLIIAMLGLTLGFIFNHLIRDIELIERKHHITAAIFIPLTATINILLMVQVATKIARIMEITLNQNALILSGVYIIVFLLPYLLSMFKRKGGR